MLEIESKNISDSLFKNMSFIVGNPPKYFDITTDLIRSFNMYKRDLQTRINMLDKCLNQKRILVRYGNIDNPIYNELEIAEDLLRDDVEAAQNIVWACIDYLKVFDERFKNRSCLEDIDAETFVGEAYDMIVIKNNPETRKLLVEFVVLYEVVSVKLWNATIDRIQAIVKAFDKRSLYHETDSSEKLVEALETNFFEWCQDLLRKLCSESVETEEFERMKNEVTEAIKLLSILSQAFDDNDFDLVSLSDIKAKIGSSILDPEFIEIISSLYQVFDRTVSKTNNGKRLRMRYLC